MLDAGTEHPKWQREAQHFILQAKLGLRQAFVHHRTRKTTKPLLRGQNGSGGPCHFGRRKALPAPSKASRTRLLWSHPCLSRSTALDQPTTHTRSQVTETEPAVPGWRVEVDSIILMCPRACEELEARVSREVRPRRGPKRPSPGASQPQKTLEVSAAQFHTRSGDRWAGR
jgi:hypothetical protein